MLDTLRDEILIWYRQNGRSLPWRDTNDPYKIWLSEIILQQTRVAQGLPYYLSFINTYPTVGQLACAEEQEVLNLWQGLGYYSRARNMLAAAKYVHFELNGVFPSTYNDILKLKGVGSYTAAAIASFAFGEKQAVLDGNVFRVLARLFNMDQNILDSSAKKSFQAMATNLLGNANPAEFNQAIMDFGALQCGVKPYCITCGLQNSCQALQNGTVAKLPVKISKLKRKTRYFHYFYYIYNGSILLKQRKAKDIWQNMYELPLIETAHQDLKIEDIEQLTDKDTMPELVFEKTHKLTHQDIKARFYTVKKMKPNEVFLAIPLNELGNYPISRLIEEFFEFLAKSALK